MPTLEMSRHNVTETPAFENVVMIFIRIKTFQKYVSIYLFEIHYT